MQCCAFAQFAKETAFACEGQLAIGGGSGIQTKQRKFAAEAIGIVVARSILGTLAIASAATSSTTRTCGTNGTSSAARDWTELRCSIVGRNASGCRTSRHVRSHLAFQIVNISADFFHAVANRSQLLLHLVVLTLQGTQRSQNVIQFIQALQHFIATGIAHRLVGFKAANRVADAASRNGFSSAIQHCDFHAPVHQVGINILPGGFRFLISHGKKFDLRRPCTIFLKESFHCGTTTTSQLLVIFLRPMPIGVADQADLESRILS